MKRTIFFVVLLSIYAVESSAQIGGLSAGKLGTFCTLPVPQNAIEFEPSVSVFVSDYFFDQSGNKISSVSNSDTIIFNNDMFFRFTYGAFKNAEVGMFLSRELSFVQSSMKYLFYTKDKSSFGAMGGLNFSFNDRVHINEVLSFAGGLIYSYVDNWSVDANIQVLRSITYGELKNHNHYFVSADVGHYFKNNIQLVSGVYYQQSFYPNTNNNQTLLSVSPGVTIEKAKNFILVLNYSIDIIGQNIEQRQGLGMALTILLD